MVKFNKGWIESVSGQLVRFELVEDQRNERVNLSVAMGALGLQLATEAVKVVLEGLLAGADKRIRVDGVYVPGERFMQLDVTPMHGGVVELKVVQLGPDPKSPEVVTMQAGRLVELLEDAIEGMDGVEVIAAPATAQALRRVMAESGEILVLGVPADNWMAVELTGAAKFAFNLDGARTIRGALQSTPARSVEVPGVCTTTWRRVVLAVFFTTRGTRLEVSWADGSRVSDVPREYVDRHAMLVAVELCVQELETREAARDERRRARTEPAVVSTTVTVAGEAFMAKSHRSPSDPERWTHVIYGGEKLDQIVSRRAADVLGRELAARLATEADVCSMVDAARRFERLFVLFVSTTRTMKYEVGVVTGDGGRDDLPALVVAVNGILDEDLPVLAAKAAERSCAAAMLV